MSAARDENIVSIIPLAATVKPDRVAAAEPAPRVADNPDILAAIVLGAPCVADADALLATIRTIETLPAGALPAPWRPVRSAILAADGAVGVGPLRDALGRAGLNGEAEGAIAELFAHGSTAEAPWAARRLREIAAEAECREIAAALGSGEATPAERLAAARARIETAAAQITDAGERRMSRPLADLLAEPEDVRPWPVAGILPPGVLCLLTGSPKSGKTWLGLDLLLRVASGLEALGQRTATGPALLVTREDPAPALRERLGMLLRGIQVDLDLSDDAVADVTSRLPLHVAGHPAPWSLAALEAEIRATGAQVCALDSLRRFLPGDENDSTEIAALTSPLIEIADRTGCTILGIDHTPKGVRITPWRAPGAAATSRPPPGRFFGSAAASQRVRPSAARATMPRSIPSSCD